MGYDTPEPIYCSSMASILELVSYDQGAKIDNQLQIGDDTTIGRAMLAWAWSRNAGVAVSGAGLHSSVRAGPARSLMFW